MFHEILISILLSLIIVSLIGMFITNNFVNVILNTLFIFILTGIIFLILEADFLAFMFLIIYAGAIVILFICCFMLMSFKPLKSQIFLNDIIKIFIFISAVMYLLVEIYTYNDILYNLIFNNAIINDLNLIWDNFLNLNLYINDFKTEFKLMNFYLFQTSSNPIELSDMSKLGIILYKEAWFETLFLGLLLLLAITYIIYLFKK